MKQSNTILTLWILALALALPTACGRTPTLGERPAAATDVAPPAPIAPEAEFPAEKAVPSDPAPAQAFFIHQVNEGDTLSSIAHWYTGKDDNWRRLSRINPTIQPQRMPIGARIRIPEELLIRREPMPRHVRPAPTRQETAPPADAVELFGPIESLAQPEASQSPLELETLE